MFWPGGDEIADTVRVFGFRKRFNTRIARMVYIGLFTGF